MGLRFRKSIKLAPGISINLSKSGVSATIGKRGASVTVGKSGTYANLGIPGTGISIREKLSGGTSTTRSQNRGSYEDHSTFDAPTSNGEPASFTISGLFCGLVGMIIWFGGIIAVCWYVLKWLFS